MNPASGMNATPGSTPLPESLPEPGDEAETFVSTVREMMAEFVSSRELLWQMTVRDLKLRYKQSLMGFGWAILMPLLLVGAGCFVRAAMAHTAGGYLSLKDISAMVVKAIAWSFFVGSASF